MNKEIMQELRKLTAKKQDGMAIAETQNVYRELVECKPLISTIAGRTTKDGKKVNTGKLQYDLNTYDANRKILEKNFEKMEPFLTGEYSLKIPRKPTIILQELFKFLKMRNYTDVDARKILKLINIYKVNLSWSQTSKEKKENELLIAELFPESKPFFVVTTLGDLCNIPKK